MYSVRWGGLGGLYLNTEASVPLQMVTGKFREGFHRICVKSWIWTGNRALSQSGCAVLGVLSSGMLLVIQSSTCGCCETRGKITLVSRIIILGIQAFLSNHNERNALAKADSTPLSNHCLWQKLNVTKILIKFQVSLGWTWTAFESVVRSKADFPEISKLANTNTGLISSSFPESKTCYNESISHSEHIHSNPAALDLDQYTITGPCDSHTGGLRYLLLPQIWAFSQLTFLRNYEISPKRWFQSKGRFTSDWLRAVDTKME